MLATWKVLVSLVMVPTMHLTYTFLAWALRSETAAVVWFFFAPFVAMGSILATERGTKLAISIRALMQSLRHAKGGQELIEARDRLQRKYTGGWSLKALKRAAVTKSREMAAAKALPPVAKAARFV